MNCGIAAVGVFPIMIIRFVLAAGVAAVLFGVEAKATCVIAPDGKSINVVTDNGADEEKNCAVKCQVDTKIGVVRISCGGNAPPRAKAHSLCDFDKPEPWYKKVIASEDTCKGTPAAAAPAAVAALKPGAFACRIAADGATVEAVISNPYKAEASCQVNCQMATTKPGTSFQISCSKSIEAGVEGIVCSKTLDKGKLVKMIGGSGTCTDPTPVKESEKEDDDDAEIEKLMGDPSKLQEHIRKLLPPEGQRMLDRMGK